MSKHQPTVQMSDTQAAIKHLQDRAELAESTCQELRATNDALTSQLEECKQSLSASQIEGDPDTVRVLASKLEEAVSRVQELADEVMAKDMIIESLRDHLSKHPVDGQPPDAGASGAAGAKPEESESDESIGPGSDEEEDEEELRLAEKAASDAMNMALLEAAFECDIDVAARLHKSGAVLPVLSELVLDLQTRSIPAEMEATAVYVVEGLRSGSPEGEGATCALLDVLSECWDKIPRLSSTVRAVCMVSDAEFCETEAALPAMLSAVHKLADRLVTVLISRSSGADEACEMPERVGTLRHEVLTFLGFVCGDVCQHVPNWPACMTKLHASGVFHMAVHNLFHYPNSSMLHVHVVSMFGGLMDYSVKVTEEAAEEGQPPPQTVAGLVLRECRLLDKSLDWLTNSRAPMLTGVLEQLVDMVSTTALNSPEINHLVQGCEGWVHYHSQLVARDKEQLAKWSRLSGSADEKPTPGSTVSGDGEPHGLGGLFDQIDADGFGFAPRVDLLARVSELAVDDSSLGFVVRSLEKMELKIVAKEDFEGMLEQWQQLHSIMEDDDKDDSSDDETDPDQRPSQIATTTSPRSPNSLLCGGPGSPKSPGIHACIDELDMPLTDTRERSNSSSSSSNSNSPTSPELKAAVEINWDVEKQRLDVEQLMDPNPNPHPHPHPHSSASSLFEEEVQPESPSEATVEGPVATWDIGGQV